MIFNIHLLLIIQLNILKKNIFFFFFFYLLLRALQSLRVKFFNFLTAFPTEYMKNEY